MSDKLRLFQAYGVELEYMIVDRETLEVRPITDTLITDMVGELSSDYEGPEVSWSNELVLHVLELKTTTPTHDLVAFNKALERDIAQINTLLKPYNAMLMPGAAHPWMNPETDMQLWPHDNAEVYELYHKIFNCKGHGWSNLQSTHLNLPFGSDDEFGRLHAAIRLLLPILPALSASSPILDGKFTGYQDTRLKYYLENQRSIPILTAELIPEPIFSESDYNTGIYDKISIDISPYDPNKILSPIWLNSRGAIARFDRGAIEIRILDIQECPAADLAIVTLVSETLKALVEEEWCTYEEQKTWESGLLKRIISRTMEDSDSAMIQDEDYLALFGVNTSHPIKAGELWSHIYQSLLKRNPETLQPWNTQLNVILKEGTLSRRILKATGTAPDRKQLTETYLKLADCLANNTMF